MGNKRIGGADEKSTAPPMWHIELNCWLKTKQRIDNCFLWESWYHKDTPVITQYGGAIMQLDLGNKIRQLRHRDGRTQEALAEALGVTA